MSSGEGGARPGSRAPDPLRDPLARPEGEGLRWLLPRAGRVSRAPALPHYSVSWTSPLLASPEIRLDSTTGIPKSDPA